MYRFPPTETKHRAEGRVGISLTLKPFILSCSVLSGGQWDNNVFWWGGDIENRNARKEVQLILIKA